MKIGDHIIKLRKKHGLSQRRLAELSDLSNTEISRIESGERQEPSPHTLMAIAPYLGVSYLELYRSAGYIDEDLIETLKQSQRLLSVIKSLYYDELDNELDTLLKGVE